MERILLLTSLALAVFSTISTEHVPNHETIYAKCSLADLSALLDFKNGLNDPEHKLSSWQGENCCRWRGIRCDNVTGAITTVDLHNPYPFSSDSDVERYGSWNLSGAISPSLTKLKFLTHLDLSFNTFGDIPVPGFFGFFKNLKYLNLTNAGFSGKIPSSIGNLSSLESLDVSTGYDSLDIPDFEWITNLESLKHLKMNGVQISDLNWLEMVNMLPYLTELHLSRCGLSSIPPLITMNFTSLAAIDLSTNFFTSSFPNWLVNITSLEYIDLSFCHFTGIIPLGLGELPNLWFLSLESNGKLNTSADSMLNGSWKSIEILDLSSNKIHGKLPRIIGRLTTLTHFSLFNNEVEGEFPITIGSLCNLVTFDMSENNMTGTLPDLLEGSEKCGHFTLLPSLVNLRLSANKLTGRLPDWLGHIPNLQDLSLRNNIFHGPIPASIGEIKNLLSLDLSENRLNGTLPDNIGQLSQLVLLDVSVNSLTGIVSEMHFNNLSKLRFLALSSNSLILNISSNWDPPFQLWKLLIGSCRLGPSFPGWVRTQYLMTELDLSNASISDSIPNWFWDMSYNLFRINVSLNQIHGSLPGSFKVALSAVLDFSSNLLEGLVPLPSFQIELFDLSNNMFQGNIPQNISTAMEKLIYLSLSGNRLEGQIPDDIGNMASLHVIDLSQNSLTGSIPNSIGNCSYLKVLDLGNNRISGEIPEQLGQLNQLQSLHLNNNFISGKLPSSLKNLSSLETLDLANNELHDTLPVWLGEGFTSLRILSLRSNAFFGEIIFDFPKLTSLQVLDLAKNNLTGRIPSSLGDLRAMARNQTTNEYLLYGGYRGVYYEERFGVNTKGQVQMFTKTLSLGTAIDLSRNNLFGEIPSELTKLNGIMSLNLSRNHISGRIPDNVSSLRLLASLDLSSNDLSGPIPSSMGSLSFLGYLNMSDNNLSGKIPDGGQLSTFGAYAFEGNHGLCGAPLEVKCFDEDESSKGNYEENEDGYVDRWFYLSNGLGFATGVLVPYIVLVIRKTWSDKYFGFVDRLVYRLLSVGGKAGYA